MAFLEQQLSPRITAGAIGGPTVPGREKIYTTSGRLKQNFQASMPIHRYDVSHGVKSAEEFQQIIDLWYVVMFGGPYQGFRFKDWRDFVLTQSNSRLIGIGGGAYNIYRTYNVGGFQFNRRIYKPVGEVTAYEVDGTPCVGVTDTVSGIFYVTSGAPATCEGQFDVPVTFTDNDWMVGLEQNLFVNSGPIKLEEIRL